jgi:glycerol-3-phosphate dehydrogenase
LPFTDDKDEQSITRQHFIRRHPDIRNLFSIVGGKLTTYRSLAEQTVDLIFQELKRKSPECLTAHAPLPGANAPDFENFCKDFKQRCGLSEPTSDHLLRVYGTRSDALLNVIADDPALGEVFDSETGAIAAEVVYSFKHELAQTLADCLLRRTMVGLNSTCGLESAEGAAAVAQEYLGWSDSCVQQEVGAYRTLRSQTSRATRPRDRRGSSSRSDG